MKTPVRGYAIAAVLLTGALLRAGQPITLTRGGQSAYSIVIDAAASPSERRAAGELQRFLEQISGARLPVVTAEQRPRGDLLLVGRSRLTDRVAPDVPYATLGPEGFALKTAGKHLVIAGGRQRGTMYGVYTFLEKLGCRWVAPGASRIPKMATIVVPALDEAQKPAFEYRETHIEVESDKDWAARNKTNGQFAALDESTGGKIQYYPWVHSFYAIVPPQKYFQSHPEYFSLVDGKRRGAGAQLCLTNPDVLRIAIDTVLRWMKEHPQATICSVSQNDFGGQCECDNCRRVEQEEGGAASGPLIRFVNAVAEAVEKQYPDKLIDTLAYFYSEAPPAKTRPRHNVRIRMCPIGACQAHPYERCPHDAYIMKNLKAWAKVTRNIYVWHYNANFSHFLLPVPDFDELAADIPMYKRNGVVGLFMQGIYPFIGSDGPLRAYVLARLLWDVNADVPRAIREFHEIYYGNAAVPMRAYFELVQDLARFPPEGEGQHWWCCRAPRFGDATLEKAKELFRQALQAAETDTIRDRVRTAELSLRYLELKRLQTFAIRGERYEPVGLDSLRRLFPAFITEARRLGVKRFSEEENIDKDEKAFADTLVSYRVLTLENEALRLRVVPEANARVVSMVDKRNGRELLNQPASVEKTYPDRSGLSVSVYPDYISAAAYKVKWTPAPASDAHELQLTGVTAEGLRLRRRIALRAGSAAIHTETIVENNSAKAIDVVIQSQFEADAGPMDDAFIEFTDAKGDLIHKKLLEPAEQPVGGATYREPGIPRGEWRIVNPSARLILANVFPPAGAGRAVLNWSAKNANRVGLSVWSRQRALAPGEGLRLDADYEAH